jgi:hypothetical protein
LRFPWGASPEVHRQIETSLRKGMRIQDLENIDEKTYPQAEE